MPRISFIVPVYNTEKYLTVCINSVMSQTSGDWELVLIDDGSTDTSGAICDMCAYSDDRIKVIHKENSGQFDSRMRGIREASGEYCTGLDSDDYLERDCVEKLTKVLDNKDYDIVAWNIREVIGGSEVTTHRMKKYGTYTGSEFLEYVCRSTNYSFCNKLIKTELLRKSRFGIVPGTIRYSEDHILITPSLCMSGSIIAVDETLYNYRQTDDSVTHKYTTKRVIDYLDSARCVLDIIADYGKSSRAVIDAEYGNLVSAVAYCLKRAYLNDQVTERDVKVIRSHSMYGRLKKYEKGRYITADQKIVMLLFRLKLDILLSALYGKHKGNKNE